jgi:hypothetical protein
VLDKVAAKTERAASGKTMGEIHSRDSIGQGAESGGGDGIAQERSSGVKKYRHSSNYSTDALLVE